MPFLTRNGCRIAYTKTLAPWGRIADVVYLPGGAEGSLLRGTQLASSGSFTQLPFHLDKPAGLASNMHG